MSNFTISLSGKTVSLPAFSDVKITVLANNKVRVEWRLDEAGDAYLEWGKTTAFGSSVVDKGLRLKYWYDIGPLEAFTTYYFLTATL